MGYTYLMISACLVIHNEEKILRRCLESIKDVVDEIIVVHDGKCADKSLDIAKKYGAKIFVRKHVGEAEYHRPFAFSKATGDWVLHIDADEYLSLELRNSIKELTNDKNISCYSFGWPITVKGRYIRSGYFSEEPRPSLFRRSNMYMIGITHEHPRTYGKTRKLPKMVLHHKPLRGEKNYTLKTLRDPGLFRAKLRASQILDIDAAPKYNIKSLGENPVYRYYKRTSSRPFYYGTLDLFKMFLLYLSKGVFFRVNSSRVAIYRLLITAISYFYLVKQKYFN